MSKDSPLFLLENKQALTRLHPLNLVSHLLRLIGVDPTAYSGHSFGIGGATSASLAGLADSGDSLVRSLKIRLIQNLRSFPTKCSTPVSPAHGKDCVNNLSICQSLPPERARFLVDS